MDGTIPRKRLAEMLSAIAGMEKKYGLRCANVFHAGDGNLHPLIMYDAAKPGEWERAESLRRRDSGTVGGPRRLDHRRAWRVAEKINQMRAIHDAGAGGLPSRQGSLHRGRPAEPRQGGAQPASLCRIRS